MSHISTKSTLAPQHVCMQDTLTREHVSTPNTLTPELIFKKICKYVAYLPAKRACKIFSRHFRPKYKLECILNTNRYKTKNAFQWRVWELSTTNHSWVMKTLFESVLPILGQNKYTNKGKFWTIFTKLFNL